LFAGELVRSDDTLPTPQITESRQAIYFQVVALDALVRRKLASFRDKDRMCLRDMVDSGLIDASWPAHLAPELAAILQELIDNPE
jgi:hypothetical protein